MAEVANAKLATHLPDIDGAPLVGEGGSAGDDEQPAGPGQCGGDVLHDAVREIRLLGIAAHVGERQHCDGRLVGRAIDDQRGAGALQRQREPIAGPRGGHDDVVSKRLAQRRDLFLQVVLVDRHGGPNLVEQFRLANQSAGSGGEHGKDTKGPPVQQQRHPVSRQGAALPVEPERPEDNVLLLRHWRWQNLPWKSSRPTRGPPLLRPA